MKHEPIIDNATVTVTEPKCFIRNLWKCHTANTMLQFVICNHDGQNNCFCHQYLRCHYRNNIMFSMQSVVVAHTSSIKVSLHELRKNKLTRIRQHWQNNAGKVKSSSDSQIGKFLLWVLHYISLMYGYAFDVWHWVSLNPMWMTYWSSQLLIPCVTKSWCIAPLSVSFSLLPSSCTNIGRLRRRKGVASVFFSISFFLSLAYNMTICSCHSPPLHSHSLESLRGHIGPPYFSIIHAPHISAAILSTVSSVVQIKKLLGSDISDLFHLSFLSFFISYLFVFITDYTNVLKLNNTESQ